MIHGPARAALFAAALAAAWHAPAPPLPWGAPVDVRIKEVRRQQGRSEVVVHYTLSIAREGEGYVVRLRGLPRMAVDGKRQGWRTVDAVMASFMPDLTTDGEGVLEGFRDEEAATAAYRAMLKAIWAKKDASFQALADDEAFVAMSLQQTLRPWLHLVTPVVDAPHVVGEVHVDTSTEEDFPGWKTDTKLDGATPGHPETLRYSVLTTVDADDLSALSTVLARRAGDRSAHGADVVSRVERIVADVLPGTLRPVHVEAEMEIAERRLDGALKTKIDRFEYDLEWVEPPSAATEGTMGICTPALVAVRSSASAASDEKVELDMSTCGAGIALDGNDGFIFTATGEAPMGALVLRVERKETAEVWTGTLARGARTTQLVSDDSPPLDVTRARGEGTSAWAKVAGAPVGAVGLRLAHTPGVQLAGEELLGDREIGLTFDAVPLASLVELIASVSDATSVTGESLRRRIIPKSERDQEHRDIEAEDD